MKRALATRQRELVLPSKPRKYSGASVQNYSTPWHIFRALEHDARRSFDIDVCADKSNAKVPGCFIDKKRNGLKVLWPRGSRAFCNPEYAEQFEWIRKALLEAAQRDVVTALLIKASTGARYWRPFVDDVGTTDFYDGRISFAAPAGGIWKGERFFDEGEIVDGSDFDNATVWIGPGVPRRTHRWRDGKTGLLIDRSAA